MPKHFALCRWMFVTAVLAMTSIASSAVIESADDVEAWARASRFHRLIQNDDLDNEEHAREHTGVDQLDSSATIDSSEIDPTTFGLLGWIDTATAATPTATSSRALQSRKFNSEKTYSLLRWLVVRMRITPPELPRDVERYDRAYHFGDWINTDRRNCYDTRAKVLMRDADPAAPVVFFPQNRCRVQRGLWNDPYTGRNFKMASSLQIDHVVPLKIAYYAGAWSWDRPRRCHYANFIANDYHLLTVHGTENLRKNDEDPSDYLPPRRAYTCHYIHIWLKIKAVWDMTIDPKEAEGIKQALAKGRCNPDDLTIGEDELREMRAHSHEIPAACMTQRTPQPKYPRPPEPQELGDPVL